MPVFLNLYMTNLYVRKDTYTYRSCAYVCVMLVCACAHISIMGLHSRVCWGCQPRPSGVHFLRCDCKMHIVTIYIYIYIYIYIQVVNSACLYIHVCICVCMHTHILIYSASCIRVHINFCLLEFVNSSCRYVCIHAWLKLDCTWYMWIIHLYTSLRMYECVY